MKLAFVFVFVFVFLPLIATAEALPRSYYDTSVWEQAERGHLFYEPPKIEIKERTLAPKPKPLLEMTAVELGKEEQLRRGIATMKPTETNVAAWMQVSKVLYDRATVFSDVWQRLTWTRPDLDIAPNSRPSNALAAATFDLQRDGNRSKLLTKLKDTHGLLFFFRGDCSFCHAFAPVLASFERETGLRVIPISLDGGALREYPNPQTNSQAAVRLQVSQTPAIYLVDLKTTDVLPIGFGVMSQQELSSRIYTLVATKPGTEF